ncbi:hypothetical protein [uncultured Limosilactobacillus sp.]|uniref:hypothetical protein n=1 Tax=uncultured Limosilactobacillus sp. TaxID=2837629 RepID=UPI002599B44B|nr:hypothetical protein [uncultured Limosilactobacillus sp.]
MKQRLSTPTYEWDIDHYTKIDMTYDDFLDMFNKAKKSEQKSIQENGYAQPDN